jgi:hypothetical protein
MLCLACAPVAWLPSSASAQSLQQQALCAAQASKVFQEDYPHRENGDMTHYQDHYNVKLDRCFILEYSTLGGGGGAILYDAFEKRKYGEYGWTTTGCELTPPNGQPEACNSKAEFDAFAAKYMNN